VQVEEEVPVVVQEALLTVEVVQVELVQEQQLIQQQVHQVLMEL
jgi:hypothetical protein